METRWLFESDDWIGSIWSRCCAVHFTAAARLLVDAHFYQFRVVLMQVSLRRSIAVVALGCLVVAAGSTWSSFIGVASAQAPADAAASEKPPKEMTQGVKVDGTTVIDLAPLMAKAKWFGQVRAVVIPVLQGQAPPTPQDLENVDNFIVWKLAELTWPAKDSKELPEARRSLFKLREPLKTPSLTPEMHDRINALALVNLPLIIADKDYSLAARYNAMLLLGQLDRIEADGVKQQAAEPLAAAEPILLAAWQSAQLPEVLRVGAFVGLARHAELQMPVSNANRATIAAEALKILTATEPPVGFSINSLHWLRKLSMQIVMGLSLKGSEVNRGDYVAALEKILVNDKLPLFLRRDAALTLGHYDPNTIAAGAKPENILKAMTSLSFEVFNAGASRENPEAPTDLAKAADVMQTPTDETRVAFANAVAYYMNCIATGLGGRNEAKGLMKVAAGDTQTQAKTLLNTYINPTVNLMGKSNAKPQELITNLNTQHGKLEAWALPLRLLAAPGVAAPVGPVGGAPQPGAILATPR